ncbi:MAG: hypothetical protein U0939_17615 [Pirellulales bacterium]
MKALEKDRSRRYETASALAVDISRYLEQQPIEARPPSPLYRNERFVRRHKRSVISACIVLLSLVAGLVTSVAWAVRAQRAEAEQRDTASRLKSAVKKALRQERNEQSQAVKAVTAQMSSAFDRSGNLLALM